MRLPEIAAYSPVEVAEVPVRERAVFAAKRLSEFPAVEEHQPEEMPVPECVELAA